MLLYCTKCKDKKEHKEQQVKLSKRLTMSGKCSTCGKVNNSFLPKSYLNNLKDEDIQKLKSGGLLSALASGHSALEALIPVMATGGSMICQVPMFDPNERRILNTAEQIANRRGLGLILATGDGLFLSGSGLYSTEHLFNLKSKIKRGGVIGIDDIIMIIIAIVSLVTAIIELVKQREAQEAEEKEKKRRAEEAKKAENEQKLYELKALLQSYNETLGELAKESSMTVKDYIIQQLKVDQSKVNKMKITILAKAKEFQMTPPDFVDYCNEIAGQYE